MLLWPSARGKGRQRAAKRSANVWLQKVSSSSTLVVLPQPESQKAAAPKTGEVALTTTFKICECWENRPQAERRDDVRLAYSARKAEAGGSQAG